MNSYRTDDFYKAIRGIDLVHFATRKIDYDKLVEMLKDQNLLPDDFDSEEFFDTEIVKAQRDRHKEIMIRVALEQSDVKMEDGQMNKLVKEIADRLPYSAFRQQTHERSRNDCDCGCDDC